MINKLVTSKYIIIFSLVVANLSAQVNNPKSYIVRTDVGFIDYANRIIVCRGTADVIKNNVDDNSLIIIEKNITLAKAEAKAEARKNLIKIIKEVNFDGRYVKELIEIEPIIESRLESLVGSAYQQGQIEYFDKDEVSIALAVRMSGLAEILIDTDGYLEEDKSLPTYLMTNAAIPKSERISGIVIDVREHDIDPSMSPEVIDMQGNLVYGTIHYSRSKSVNKGPVGYAYSMDDKNLGQRVGANPILIEAVGSLDDDVYITSMDAEKIREAEKKFGILTNCRIMLLLQ
tara:strand:+ start:1015 stop:1878 length:864 start_codon:yes stop_codon:yes gene_type:complete